MLDELSGMYAFAIADRARRRLHLVRDPYGMRPMFTLTRDKKLYFASELRAFYEIEGFTPSVDKRAVWDLMSLVYIPGERTPLEGIVELRAGTHLDVDLGTGQVEIHRFHRISYSGEGPSDPDQAARLVRETLSDSVEKNLVADVPVGLTLSGGVDSSSILALAAEQGRAKDLHTFSIRMEDESFDEGLYQKAVTERYKTHHHEINVGAESVLAELERHMAFLGEPSGDGAAIPLFLLGREAGKHVRVLLSGEGGDEVFDAYETHRALHWRALYRKAVPGPLRAAAQVLGEMLPVGHSKLSLDFLIKRFSQGAELDVPEAHHCWRHAFSESEKRALMPGADFPPTETLFRELYDSSQGKTDLDRIGEIDLTYYFVDDLMVKDDRMAMAHSVESRFPYLDPAVTGLASSLPADLRVRGGEGRWIQKRAMRGLLPSSVLRRKNMGLEMPHSKWFLGPLRKTADEWFSKDRVGRSGLFDPAVVQRLWQDHLERKKDLGRPLWTLLNFLIWHDLYIDSKRFKDFSAS